MITSPAWWTYIIGKIRAKFPLDMNSQKIHNLTDPTANQEAATKKYVDDNVGGGAGDMTMAVYDPNEDGVVKDSDKLEAQTKAQVRDHTPKAHTLASHSTKAHSELTDVLANQHHAQAHGHVEDDISDLDHNAQKIKSKLVDAPLAGDDGKVLTYDHANSKYKHTTPGGGFPAPDYESAWTSVNPAASANFNHNLNSTNLLVQVWVNTAGNWTNASLFSVNAIDKGASPGLVRITTVNQIQVFNDLNPPANFFKVRAWKWA